MSKLISVRSGARCVALASLALSLGVQASPAVAQTVGAPQPVPKGEGQRLTSVSCGSSTECVAIGTTTGDSSRLVAVRISGGRILPAVKSSSIGGFGESFSDVACPTASDCIAVGSNLSTIRNGTPGPFRPLPANARAYLRSVSCWTATDCVAVGGGDPDGDGRPSAIVVSIKDGVAGPPVSVPGATILTQVECRSATCQSIGVTPATFGANGLPVSRGEAAVVTITNGVPGEPVLVPGGDQFDIACPSATTCLMTGGGSAPPPFPGTPPGPAQGARVITLVNGKPGTTRTVTNPETTPMLSLACKSTTSCLGLGRTNGDSFYAVSFTDTQAGQWRLFPGGSYTDSTCVGSAGCLAVGGTNGGNGLYNMSVISLGYRLGAAAPGAGLTAPPKASASGVTLTVGCTGATGRSCAVKAAVTTLVSGRPVVVGTKAVTVKDGKTSTLMVRLNAKGKQLLVRTHRLAVTLKVSSTTGGKSGTVIKRRLTLRR